MEIKAKAKYIRLSPRKTRLIADLIRGLDVKEAENQLIFLRKAAARPVLKLLKSAIANALNNFKLKEENLYIKSITVDSGPTLKRWQPRAFGRATPIRKRSAHISIVLAEKKGAIVSQKIVESVKKPEVVKVAEPLRISAPVDVEEKKAREKEVPKEFKKTKGFFKRIFTRKSGM